VDVNGVKNVRRAKACLVLLLALVAASCSRRCGSASAPEKTVAGSTSGAGLTAAGTPGVLTLETGEFTRLLAAFQALPAKVDRSAFDVAAKASSLGSSPDAAFAFVRDEIANDLYPGVLRGSAGTLQARSGNDLDKSLLLAALLSAMGGEIRFARCDLTAETVQQRIAEVWRERHGSQAKPDDIRATLKTVLVQNGLSDARASTLAEGRQRARDTLDQAVRVTAASDFEVVRGAMSRAGIGFRPLPSDNRLAEEARSHFWVQFKREEGWQDLDPSISSHKAGSTICSIADTVAELPAQVFQTLTVSIRNEYIDGEALRSETVLTQQFRTSDLHGQILMLNNVGLEGEGEMLQKAGGIDRFVPFLSVNEDVFPGEEFRVASKAAAGAGGMFGAFGGAVSRDSEASSIAAQWIDFVIEAPGRRSEVSRALVDWVDPAERRTGVIKTRANSAAVVVALEQSAAIAISAGPIHPAAAMGSAFRDLDAAAVGRVFDGLTQPSDQTDTDWAAIGDRLLGAKALAYAVASERMLQVLSASSGANLRLIRDQPMIAITNLSIRLGADGKPTAEASVDLRHSRIRVLTKSDQYVSEAAWANVMHGLIDGALEHHLSQPTVQPRNGLPDSNSATIDTSRILELARAQQIDVRAAVGSSANELLLGALASVGGVRLAAEVTDVTAIVAPSRAPSFNGRQKFGLWTVDLQTGELLSLLDTGLRGQQGEYEKLNRLVNFLQTQVRRCVANLATPGGRGRMSRCRAMFDMWAQAANELLKASRGGVKLDVSGGNFMGWFLL
jgi:hypothetical protein